MALRGGSPQRAEQPPRVLHLTIVFEAAATRALYIPYADSERLVAMPYGIELDAIERFRSTLTRD
jgi:hypothetical protein